MTEELIFHFSGDDHEERVCYALDESLAREQCASDFNEQYDAHYGGDDFELLAVYRVLIDGSDIDENSVSDAEDQASIKRISFWPKGETAS